MVLYSTSLSLSFFMVTSRTDVNVVLSCFGNQSAPVIGAEMHRKVKGVLVNIVT